MDRMIKKLLVMMITASFLAADIPVCIFAEEIITEEIITEEIITEKPETPENEEDDTVSEDSAMLSSVCLSAVSSSSGVTLTFDDRNVSSSDGNTYNAVSDSNGDYYLEISDGSYILTGSAKDIYLSVTQGAVVSFELDDLTVNNDGMKSAFITAAKSTDIDITLNGSSCINDGTGFVSQKKSSTLNIGGSGSVTVDGSESDAIKTKGTLNISEGTIVLTNCLEDGIQAENLNIYGGRLDIDTFYANATDGFYTGGRYSSGSSTAYNYIWESGDNIKYERINVDTGSHKGIKVGTKAKTYAFSDSGGSVSPESASGTLNISGGTINIDTSKTGIKANGLYTGGYTATSSGKYIIGSPDDAISSNNDIVISGGTISIHSADDGLAAMGNMDINGTANINIYAAYEGIEAQTVNIGSAGSPVINIWSCDDGINTSGKTLTYTYDTYSGYESDEDTGYVKKTVSTATGNNLTINGGMVRVYIDSEGTKSISLPDGSLSSLKTVVYRSAGDGLDCNGALTQNGGEIYVYGQSTGDNSPIDTNDGYTFNSGAKVLGAGVDGMNESTPNNGSGSYITYGSGGGAPGGQMPGSQIMSADSDDAELDSPMDNGTQPSMPGGNNGNTPTSVPGSENGGMQGAFNAGQYWVVTDSDGVVADCGRLEYAGSFIVYGSPLIANGNYTLSVSDTELSAGSIYKTDTDTSGSSAITGSFNIGSETYEYSYTPNVSYNGLKLSLDDLRINGQAAGSSLSGNIIFKKVRYKKNKNVGTASAIPVFKAAKGSDASTRKAIRNVNKYFRSNPLIFNVTACSLSDKKLSGSAVYKAEKGKWSFSLKADTGASDPVKLKINRDFTVVENSYDETKGTVMLKGCGNFTGETTLSGVTVK